MQHITVLQTEAIQELNLHEGSVVVDCTLGSAGHAAAIVKRLGKKGVYIGIDADPAAIKSAKAKLTGKPAIHLVNDNFKNLRAILHTLQYEQVDAVLADLGWRMEQFSSSEGEPRGFSFHSEEPLAMTFGDPKHYAFTAADIVNDWLEEDIANVIYAYGQERFARRIAKAIVAAREEQPITTAKALGDLVSQAVPAFARRGKTHPATKTFQALRIAVNDEFDTLTALLHDGFAALAPDGRMAIISFHSLEDRIVKETFKTFVRDHQGVLVHKKPITPSKEELLANPRARSAKLRIIEKA